MYNQIVRSVLAASALLCTSFFMSAQSQSDTMSSQEKLQQGAMEIAQAVARAGTQDDLAALAQVLPRWDAFYSAFNEAIGRKLESEVAPIRDSWKTESFCDEWVRNYRLNCHENDLEFMHLKPSEVLDVTCGKDLDGGVPAQVCYANLTFVDGRGTKGTFRMLTLVDHGQLWLADEVEVLLNCTPKCVARCAQHSVGAGRCVV